MCRLIPVCELTKATTQIAHATSTISVDSWRLQLVVRPANREHARIPIVGKGSFDQATLVL
jgi:hypothetical protein